LQRRIIHGQLLSFGVSADAAGGVPLRHLDASRNAGQELQGLLQSQALRHLRADHASQIASWRTISHNVREAASVDGLMVQIVAVIKRAQAAARDASQSSSTFTMSAISQSLLVTFAAIAGVIFKV
jgi:hypothetical protein